MHWPDNRFIFRIPYQKNKALNAYEQTVEFFHTKEGIKDTVFGLLEGLADDEWIYWCIDDKFLIAIDQDAATYFSDWVSKLSDPTIDGLCFCRARRLFSSGTVSEAPVVRTTRGDALLLRRNFNQIWLHQFLRVRTLRYLFEKFPNSNFKAREMDKFKDALSMPHGANLYVTENNFAVFGESTIDGKLTKGCLASMESLYIEAPVGFDSVNINFVIGSLGGIVGD
jgi:hypothetical protein